MSEEGALRNGFEKTLKGNRGTCQLLSDVPSNISPLGELTEEQHLTLSNSAIWAVRMEAKFWKMRVCNLLLSLIYSWYKSRYLTLFCRAGSEFLLPEPDVILSSFHTGRV